MSPASLPILRLIIAAITQINKSTVHEDFERAGLGNLREVLEETSGGNVRVGRNAGNCEFESDEVPSWTK